MITIKARGLPALRKALKEIDREFGKELRQVWLRAAQHIAGRANAALPARARGEFKGRATQRAAFIRATPKRGDELAVFLGQTRRTGWYRKARYWNSKGRQFRPWVGNQWDPGEAGGKPYFIGDAVNQAVEDTVDMVDEGIDHVARRAGFH